MPLPGHLEHRSHDPRRTPSCQDWLSSRESWAASSGARATRRPLARRSTITSPVNPSEYSIATVPVAQGTQSRACLSIMGQRADDLRRDGILANLDVLVTDFGLIEQLRAHLRMLRTLPRASTRTERFCVATSLRTECAGGFVSQALGVKLPPLGESVLARVHRRALPGAGCMPAGLFGRSLVRRSRTSAGRGADAAWRDEPVRVIRSALLWPCLVSIIVANFALTEVARTDAF